jgi:hypothetical protein
MSASCREARPPKVLPLRAAPHAQIALGRALVSPPLRAGNVPGHHVWPVIHAVSGGLFLRSHDSRASRTAARHMVFSMIFRSSSTVLALVR